MTAMLLATKCPHCKTTFKVANDQLKLQSGLVRCGICNQVFNGIDHLTATNNASNTLKINAPVAAPNKEPVESNPVPRTEESSSIQTGAAKREFDLFDEFKITPETTDRIEPNQDPDTHHPQWAETFSPSMHNEEFSPTQSNAEIEAKAQTLPEADLEAEEELSGMPAKSDEGPIEEFGPEQAYEHEYTIPPDKDTDLRSLLPDHAEAKSHDEGDDKDGENEIAELTFIRQANAKKRITLIFSTATILLFIVLAAQGIYQFRDLIAASYPSSKNTLVFLCKLAHCQISLPAQLDAISYEADELHTLPRDNTLEFSLLMRNHKSLPQAWPNIELTLKDNKKVVLRRVFNPAEYLTNPRDISNGFPPNQEQPVKLYFVLNQVKASDYVVAIFYS